MGRATPLCPWAPGLPKGSGWLCCDRHWVSVQFPTGLEAGLGQVPGPALWSVLGKAEQNMRNTENTGWECQGL